MLKHIVIAGIAATACGKPFPGLGHIRAEAQGYAWLPANYGTRF